MAKLGQLLPSREDELTANRVEVTAPGCELGCSRDCHHRRAGSLFGSFDVRQDRPALRVARTQGERKPSLDPRFPMLARQKERFRTQPVTARIGWMDRGGRCPRVRMRKETLGVAVGIASQSGDHKEKERRSPHRGIMEPCPK